MSKNLHLAALITLGVAFALLLTVQYVPWGGHKEEGTTPGGFPGGGIAYETSMVVTLWGLDFRSENDFGGGASDEGWYSDVWSEDGETPDGLASIRAGVPLVLVATVLAGVAVALHALRYGNAAGTVGLAGGLLGIVGAVLFANGVSELFEPIKVTWGVGLVLGILGLVALVAGAVMAMVLPDDHAAPTARPATRVDFD